MLTLPLPVVVALVLIYAAARAWWGSGAARWHPLMVMLVAAVAGQSLLVALVQHYGWLGIRWLQPITASALPPLAWCAFVSVQVRPLQGRDALHAGVPFVVMLAWLGWPDGLDLLVIASFTVYGLALLLVLRSSAAELPLARLGSGNTPKWMWRTVAMGLLLSGLGDGLIYLDQLMQWGVSRGMAISVMSSLMLLALGWIGLSPEWRMSSPEWASSNEFASADTADAVEDSAAVTVCAGADPALLARLDAHMREARPWLNPDLTLIALARKLGVPAKALSAAVNQGHGENVARYVNRYRVEHACALMLAGHPVTAALLDSGFNTKSNFHRAFLHLHQVSPTQWLAQQRQSRVYTRPEATPPNRSPSISGTPAKAARSVS